jgi:hypothetical protein
MLELYQKAADQGLHAAQCALAKCYLYGRGVPLDWAKATSIMTAAAEGYPAAMVILARHSSHSSVFRVSCHACVPSRACVVRVVFCIPDVSRLARWYEMGYNKLVPDTRKAMEYAIRAVYEKEIDAWDIFLRYTRTRTRTRARARTRARTRTRPTTRHSANISIPLKIAIVPLRGGQEGTHARGAVALQHQL